MSSVVQYPTPITITKKMQNNTTQKPKEINISFIIPKDKTLGFFNINEREGVIRKSSPAKSNMLATFKPTIHSLIPELQQLTGDELQKLLEEDEEDDS